MESFIWLIPTFPLLGALVCFLAHLRPGEGTRTSWVGGFATFVVLASFGFAASLFFQMQDGMVLQATVFEWFQAGTLSIPFKLQIDALSMTLVLVITGVGSLIHFYSMDYMKEDPGYNRYFACLNLFVTAMLLLVMGANLPLMFIGWEGVGLCSYLLIGFFYDKKVPPLAGQKAFIVNRIGDLGFLLGMFLLFASVGSLDFTDVNAAASGATPLLDPTTATLAAILMFLGAAGKSAQLPLYVWLPDAMAGPTPVSALIHAATMVTAGVYMVCRLSAVFALSETALLVVAIVGAATALFAATMALVETDIKKILAYSTVSQLGYMFLGAGVGAYNAAVFHLVTHAFFKALLFLGAGSVIHAMGGQQDVCKMGGLRSKIPKTHWTFLIGALTLAGLPLASGFFSKDAILWAAVRQNDMLHYVLWGMGTLTALMTAFYSGRLYLLVFWGKPRFGAEVHPHESPFKMTIPLAILAILSVAAIYLSPTAVTHKPGPLDEWLAPVFTSAWNLTGNLNQGKEYLAASLETLFVGISIAIVLIGLGLAWAFYSREGFSRAEKIQQGAPVLYKLFRNHYWVDEAYQFLVVAPLRLFSIGCSLFDLFVIDGFVNLWNTGAQAAGRALRRVQTGHLQSYAVWIGMGAVVALTAVLVF